ncbi:MAG: DMT family transporter [Proteobacteria bacterium]|nr:DMT family transporter [Pseudomonadota bacterium]
MNLFLYIMTVFVWGSTWLAINYQIGAVPTEVSIFYRFSLAAFLIFCWCFFKRTRLKFSWKTHLFFIAQGLFQFSLNYLAAYEAYHYIPSGLNAIGFSMVLVFNIINSAIFFRTPVTVPIFVGATSGIVGILTIFWPAIATLDLTNASLVGVILSITGGLLSSFGNIISVRNQQNNIPVTESNVYGMGYGALALLAVIWIKGLPFQFDFSFPYVSSLLYLAIFGSIVAFGCYLTLLGRIGASKASYALVVVPVVALILSTLFENFVWESRIFIGVALILLGNIIILARKPSKEVKKEVVPLSNFKEAA